MALPPGAEQALQMLSLRQRVGEFPERDAEVEVVYILSRGSPPGQLPPVLFSSTMPYGMGCPSVLSQLLVHPQLLHWQGSVRNSKGLDLVLALLSNN